MELNSMSLIKLKLKKFFRKYCVDYYGISWYVTVLIAY
jgi:hypothetical protein